MFLSLAPGSSSLSLTAVSSPKLPTGSSSLRLSGVFSLNQMQLAAAGCLPPQHPLTYPSARAGLGVPRRSPSAHPGLGVPRRSPAAKYSPAGPCTLGLTGKSWTADPGPRCPPPPKPSFHFLPKVHLPSALLVGTPWHDTPKQLPPWAGKREAVTPPP